MSTLKKYIVAVIIGFFVVAVFTITNVLLIRMNKNSRQRIQEQSKIITRQGAVIDSLLQRREKFIDVQLYVTDKSNNKIYGRYNKGTIAMPQEKVYRLEIDSTNFKIK